MASIDPAASLRMTSSPLDSFTQQLVYAVPLLLCVFVAGAIAGVLIHTFGKQFVRFLRGLPHVWSSPRATQVLIVEDNPDSREMLEEYLTSRDYKVATAGDLQTGIDFLKKKNRFDAIISDITLPDGTGYTLINEARRRGIRALSIAMSGYPYPSNVNEPGVTGFDYHLSKPLDCDDLCSLLKQSLASEGDASTKV